MSANPRNTYVHFDEWQRERYREGEIDRETLEQITGPPMTFSAVDPEERDRIAAAARRHAIQGETPELSEKDYPKP